LLLSDFYYALPENLIALHPPAQRGMSRLLDLRGVQPKDSQFVQFLEMCDPGDLLVMNDTRVVKARLLGRKESGGKVEVMLERPQPDGSWLAMLRASHTPVVGSLLYFGNKDEVCLEMRGRVGDLFLLKLKSGAESMEVVMREYGQLPLPPYMERPPEQDDEERYQTVYAQDPGAVAAPTAGLHFSEEFLEALKNKGVEIQFVTLHVGAGTFQPVRVENVAAHRMHPERYFIPHSTMEAVQKAKADDRRITAVGTTSLRALEAAADEAQEGRFMAEQGDTRLFITPGYNFKIVDRLLTNFHLPKSTLLMLVQAFGGIERLKQAYQHAVQERYRFFSYGDAMVIDRMSLK
jgi:S-adenosylmethionine:tRNA ribosyltransferase-isomerase